jgi:FkbM family methyltransferase
MTRAGSDYGGWFIPDDMPAGALCYCIGVGRDATFDIALAARGAEVHSFDPTPLSVAYMAETPHPGVTFHPWGLWSEDTTIRLYAPADPRHSSHFFRDLHQTGKYHEVPCYRLSTIREKLGHGEIYLLKMDIEGSWYDTLHEFVPAGILPRFLGVEFDSPAPPTRVAATVRLLEGAGYRLVRQEGDNVTFMRRGEND